MRTLIMRHSKKSVQDSGAWQLPPKSEELVPINFSQREWKTYKTSYDSVKLAFSVYENGGPAMCNKHVISIMALLAPLRRLCSGGKHKLSSLTVALPDLNVQRAGPGPSEDGPSFPSEDDTECCVCFETFENPVRTNVCSTFTPACQVTHLQLLADLCVKTVSSLFCFVLWRMVVWHDEIPWSSSL